MIITNSIYRFECSNAIERYRAESLFTKEEGTVRWLINEVKEGDVLYDIGANIGLYTVVAAYMGAFVVAFEPHAANIQSLETNIALNGVAAQVQIITRPLNDKPGMIEFNYASLDAGSSGSQLGHTTAESGHLFVPKLRQPMQATSVDEMLAQGARPPQLIKLDVDGNELLVLHGAEGLLHSGYARSIQVEMHPKDDEAIVEFLDGYGYRLVERHYTEIGKRAMAQGTDPARIAHNAVFTKV